MTDKQRYIPQGYVQYSPEIGDYPKDLFACYVNLERPHKPTAMFFVGKQSKPKWHYSFATVEAMKKEINQTISRLMSWEDMKAERKEKRKEEKQKFIQNLQVGDLFCYSWGYEQTNVDFFQVTEIKGKKFTIKPIGGKSVEGSGGDYNGMADRVTAVKDSFLKESEHTKTLVKSSLSMPFGILQKTTETEPHYRSWYY